LRRAAGVYETGWRRSPSLAKWTEGTIRWRSLATSASNARFSGGVSSRPVRAGKFSWNVERWREPARAQFAQRRRGAEPYALGIRGIGLVARIFKGVPL